MWPYLPGDVGFPASPGFRQVLQDGARLVLLDPLRHHVQDVMHHLQPAQITCPVTDLLSFNQITY